MIEKLPNCAPGMCHADINRPCGKTCRYAQCIGDSPAMDPEDDPLNAARGVLNGLILSVFLNAIAIMLGMVAAELWRWFK